MIFYIPVVHALVIFPVVEMDFPDLPFYSFLLYDVHLHTHANTNESHRHNAELRKSDTRIHNIYSGRKFNNRYR